MPPLDNSHVVEINEIESESVDVSVAAIPYETLDDGSISSIPEQPELRKFINVSETNNHDDGCDSDGELGPFYDAVVNEMEMDNAYVESNLNEIEPLPPPPPPLPPPPPPPQVENVPTPVAIDVLCACLDRCMMPGLRAAATHKCPVCKLNIHGICGVPNPVGDTSITYSQICFSCHEKDNTTESEANTTDDTVSSYTRDNLTKLKNIELKSILKDNRLRVAGNKDVLVERILHHFRVGATELTVNEAAPPTDHPTHTRWRILQTEEEPIPLPCDKVFFNPITKDINPSTAIVRRFNFPDRFERETFNEESDFYIFDRRGNIKVDKHNTPVTEKRRRTSGQPKVSWLERNQLSPASHPVSFMEVILSRDGTPEEKRRRRHQKRVSLFTDWKNYTNLKASLCGAGHDIYKDWYEFSVEEMRMHIGLYVLDGISPSPRVEMKFDTQNNDPVNGNDLVNESFGGAPSKATRRHAMFKSFFGVQDPRVLSP